MITQQLGETNMKKFKLKDLNPELMKSLISLKTKDEIVAFANKNNLEISDKQVEKLIQIAGQASTLSAEELDKVVGGGWHGNPWFETS